MFGVESRDSRRIVSEIADYMKDQGLTVVTVNLTDSSPYAVLSGKSSVGYRTRSKWNRTGIVFFCSDADTKNISQKLDVEIYDNADKDRPNAIFVTDSQVPEIVEIFKQNPLNISYQNRSSSTRKIDSAPKGTSYQNKYWTDYFPHVKMCLARDGYSNSDSNTETTVRDTFYLERKDSRDFLSWFEDENTVEEAKQRVSELLAAAGRVSSSLKNDIKYYSRDIDYFAEFYWKLQGKAYGSGKLSPYEFIKILKNKSNVSLVKGREDGRYYVRKEYTVFNEEVFLKLKDEQISGLPRLVEVKKQNGKLYTVEEYIDGCSLYEMVEKQGMLSEDAVRNITMVLCRILKRLHHMTPPMIHRDIKPSNIMIGQDKSVYLIDFNASKEVHENTSEDTVLYGTQYFAAPEQLTGYKASEPTADIFGLGATISYILTGMYHSQVIAPGRYQKILERCLRLDPKDRYQSIEEFEADFLKA